jgi:hypothetical protein
LLTIQTQKSKAVDLTALSYTKEYIDQYCQHIKADTDPKAHFLYAKYFIDTTKKNRYRCQGPMLSYFEIVFSIVHGFYINILPNCTVAGREFVFRMGAEMLLYQLKWA